MRLLMNRIIMVLLGVAVLAGIAVFFTAASGGVASAFFDRWDAFNERSRGGSMRGSGMYNGYQGYQGSRYDSGWKDALDDKSNGFDLLQEQIDNFNRARQWDDFHNHKYGYGNPKECTSKETWTPRCAYHR
jgi:hypothetical protein